MGLIRRTIYWSFVLCIWGGIAVAGTVIYFAAKMPQTTTWTIPDRPPNVKIVSVEGDLIANRGATGGEAIGLHQMSPTCRRQWWRSKTAASIRILVSIPSASSAPWRPM